MREDPSEMNAFYRRWLFNAATGMAAANGDLESLQWLMESYLPGEFLTKAVATGALTQGHTEVVEWLREHTVPRAECMVGVMDAAVSAGYLSVVKRRHEEYNVSMRSAISNAMDNQQWEISQWILEHRELVMPWISWDLPAKDGAL
ncbi:hypothetical protein V7S43_018956 [Phytophthora oleae]|uniref:Uncharacterized protein n=1 Tax=Phytophthora oleae TaxID=2107226 RepID=A0ABD3EPP6_9STRA